MSDAAMLRTLLLDMRDAYRRGDNVMALARSLLGDSANATISTLVAYDLQAGSYIAEARRSPDFMTRWCDQLAELLDPYIEHDSTVLEVGCGEATTLAGVLARLGDRTPGAFGLDISWSRVDAGRRWLNDADVAARLFVADLFEIPLDDDAIDVVYTSHSLEPNGGREAEAIRELCRVARRAVVLVEPLYELAPPAARKRMEAHGYVRGLAEAAQTAGGTVVDHRLLNVANNPLNPSGVVVIEAVGATAEDPAATKPEGVAWRCPLTHVALEERDDVFVAEETGLVYPILRGVPLLRAAHAVVASHLPAAPAAQRSIP